MRKLLLLFTLFLALVLALNFSILPVLVGIEPFIHIYRYESSDGIFIIKEYPEKGGGFDPVMTRFEHYKKEKQDSSIQLFRNSKIEFWKYWRWRDYLNHPRWRLKYLPEN